MKISVRVLSLWSTMSLVACGGGGGSSGPAAKPGTVNKQGAASVVTMTGTLKSSLSTGDGASLSGAVTSIGLSGAQQIVQPSTTGALTAVTGALSTPGPNGGTVDCTDTGCVYSQYKSGTTTMNGSVKSATAAGKTTVTSDLTIAAAATAGQMGDVTWKLTGSLDFTDTSIDGELQATAHSTLAAGGQNIAYDYYDLVRYDALVLDAGGKGTGGDIYAKWGITVAGVPQASQAYDGTVTFP